MGFSTVKKLADADAAGRTFTSHFRKAYTSNAGSFQWFDTSMVGGGPPANYYASSPLVAATLDGSAGLYHGADKTPSSLYLTHWGIVGTSTNNRGQYILQDYLLYYPFVDCDDTTQQDMTNSVTLPRYTSGDGVMVMAVCVSPSVGNGSFRFDYVNQSGVAKTSPTQTCPTSGNTALIGNLVADPGNGSNSSHYLTLAAGDSGVRSITSITFLVANGGLMSLVLVKPLADNAIREASTMSEKQFVARAPGTPRIYDGAYLGMIGFLPAGQNATQITGYLKFAWDEG